MLESSRMYPLLSKTFIAFFAFAVTGFGISASISPGDSSPIPEKVTYAAAPADQTAAALPTPPEPQVPAAPAPQAPQANKFAVIIGIDYDHTDFGEVKYADQDAATVYNMLTGQMGFPPNNVVLLQDSQATMENIIYALDWLTTNPAVDANSEVVFFYSGHGLRNGPGDGMNVPGLSPGYALVPFDFYNYNFKMGAGMIWNWDLADRLARIHPGRMWISIDSCFSGGFLQPGITGPNRVVTTSSQADQLSSEMPEAQRGAFTKFIVDDGIARGKSVEDAFLAAYGPTLGFSQTPQIADDNPGGTDL